MRVFVGLSGGVDSSVAAYLLKRQGHDVAGVFLRCMNLDGCADADAEDARKVAAHLGIPFYAWDFEEQYRKAVVEPLVAGYAHGLTPNPDVACNRIIKFGAFLDAAREAGADAVATGHYARVVDKDGMPRLAAGVDKEKDQSYFLALLTEEQLVRAIFPLGNLDKPEVRRIAAEAGLHTATKKDSQGICFLGKVSLSEYLRTQLSARAGIVVDPDGKEVGEHDGAWFYTVGQRSGFRITQRRGSAPTPPYYVAARDISTNTLTVAEVADEKLTMGGALLTEIVGHRLPDGPVPVLARTRYRQPLVPAVFDPGLGEVRFAAPHPIAAPGQIAACYEADGTVLAAGVIAETL